MIYQLHNKTGAHLGFLKGRGVFLKLGHIFHFFQINSDKLRARIVMLDLRGIKFYNIFNGNTIVDAVLKILYSRLLQSAIFES